MSHEFLKSQPLKVYVILAETLEGWQNPTSEAGKKVLGKHYEWGAALKRNNVLLLAGPLLVEEINQDSTGLITGIIFLNVSSKKEAEVWALQDPFHINGYRKNVVRSMKITATSNALLPVLNELTNKKQYEKNRINNWGH